MRALKALFKYYFLKCMGQEGLKTNESYWYYHTDQQKRSKFNLGKSRLDGFCEKDTWQSLKRKHLRWRRFPVKLQLRIYNKKSSTFYQLLKKYKSATNHTRNFQYLAKEIVKVKIDISPTIITEIFKFCDNAIHNLRSVKFQNAGIIELITLVQNQYQLQALKFERQSLKI